MMLIFIRTIILYIIVVFSFRFMGKRQLGELQTSELVITILISNIASISIENTSIPLFSSVIPILVLVCLEVVVSGISMVNQRFKNIICGNPIVIIQKGKIIQSALRSLRFTADDVIEELREQGIFDVRDIEFAVVETDGKISIFKKADKQELTAEMASIELPPAYPSLLIVSDGSLVFKGLQTLGLTKKWVEHTLKSENIDLKNVFIMMSNENKEYYIIPKDSVKQKNA